MNFQKHKNLIILLLGTIILISISVGWAFKTVNNKKLENGENKISFIEFINNGKSVSFKQVIIRSYQQKKLH